MGKEKSKKKKRLNWGILGVAKINERLLPAFAKAANAKVTAIASRSQDRAQSAAKKAGIPTAYGRYECLLADPTIDAVYIPLPNTLHAEWTKKAADHGKHVMCEKPLAPSAGDAQHLLDYCRDKGVHLMDGFMWPHHPRTNALRATLDRGTIGEVRRVSASFTFRMADLESGNIRLQAELGGGSLLDVGCYPVFGIRWAFQAEPVRVFAVAQYAHGVDVAMNGILWFGDDRMATFDCGFTLPLRQSMEIAGTTGSIYVEEMWLPPRKANFRIRRDGKSTKKVIVAGEDQIVHMIEDFGREVTIGAPVRSDPQEAVKTLRVLDALSESARTGKIVELVQTTA